MPEHCISKKHEGTREGRFRLLRKVVVCPQRSIAHDRAHTSARVARPTPPNTARRPPASSVPLTREGVKWGLPSPPAAASDALRSTRVPRCPLARFLSNDVDLARVLRHLQHELRAEHPADRLRRLRQASSTCAARDHWNAAMLAGPNQDLADRYLQPAQALWACGISAAPARPEKDQAGEKRALTMAPSASAASTPPRAQPGG